MAAYYDGYDYSSYWDGREYEHESEVIAIRKIFHKIKKIDRSLEVGGGFGRLMPYYVYRTKTAILSEPSSKLLSLAKSRLKSYKNIKFVQSTLTNLPKKIRKGSIDLVMMIRVMHHITDPDEAFKIINSLLSENGYFILEFANKIHFKNVIEHLAKKDLKFITNKESIDVRSEKAKKKKMITFLNYHPSLIKEKLINNGFEILDILSVSNIRSPYMKERLPKNALLEIEKVLQKPMSYMYFGPSIFVLARKKG